MTLPPAIALPDPTLKDSIFAALSHFGQAWNMTVQAIRVSFHTPLEWRETAQQIQAWDSFARYRVRDEHLHRHGHERAVRVRPAEVWRHGVQGRVVAISFARELAPTLTAVIVGGRIGAGMTAELGSMAVTEQIDAIQALGADPIKKLVAPR